MSLALARAQLEARNFAEAWDLAASIASTDPRQGEAWHVLGVAAAGLGDNRAAETHLARAAALRPQDGGIARNYGAVLARQKRLPDAVREFQRALAIDPSRQRGRGDAGQGAGQSGPSGGCALHPARRPGKGAGQYRPDVAHGQSAGPPPHGDRWLAGPGRTARPVDGSGARAGAGRTLERSGGALQRMPDASARSGPRGPPRAAAAAHSRRRGGDRVAPPGPGRAAGCACRAAIGDRRFPRAGAAHGLLSRLSPAGRPAAAGKDRAVSSQDLPRPRLAGAPCCELARTPGEPAPEDRLPFGTVPPAHHRPGQSRPGREIAARGYRADPDPRAGTARRDERGHRPCRRPGAGIAEGSGRCARGDRRGRARPAALCRYRHGGADLFPRLRPAGAGAMRHLGTSRDHRHSGHGLLPLGPRIGSPRMASAITASG